MKKRVRASWLIIILIGIIISLSCSAMYQSKHFDLDQFYDAGAEYSYQSQFYNASTDTIIYDAIKNQLNVVADEAMQLYWFETDAYRWNYISCKIKQMNTASMQWRLEFLDENGNAIGTKEWDLTQGENILPLGEVKFKGLCIHVDGQNGLEYTIGNVVLRDKLSTFSIQKFILAAVIFLCIYLVLAYALYQKYQKKQYRWDIYCVVDALQSVYIRIGQWGLKCKNLKNRSLLRTILFFAIFMISLMFTNFELYTEPEGYKYMIAICVILLYAIAFISIEKPLTKKDWRTPLTMAWVSLWILVIISDFIVDKFYCYTGWIMLLCMTFFYFVVQNMKNPFQIFDEVAHAFEFTFVINTVGNVISRPMITGQRYCGMYKNPNVFSFYLVIILCCFLLELDKCSMKKNKKNARFVIGILLVLEQLWLTQSFTGIIMTGVIFIIWILRRRMLYHTEKVHEKRTWKDLIRWVITGVLSVICMCVFYFGIRYLPDLLGIRIVYPSDYYQVELPQYSWTMDVWAAEGNIITNSRIYKKLFQSHSIESLTTGRNSLYRMFLQNMNLWGHYYKLEMAGSNFSAHNEFIGMAYRYGVFAIVPYLCLIVCIIKSVIKRFFKYYKENPYVFFIAGIMAACILKLLSDKFEQPFRSVGWMLFYYVIGFLLSSGDTGWRRPNDTGEMVKK